MLSVLYDPTPYTKALQVLQERYGQPRQVVQGELSSILAMPFVKYKNAIYDTESAYLKSVKDN
jgi:hypothetical protein